MRPSLTFKGTQIGSDIGGIPWGWFLAAAGLVFFLASCRGAGRLMLTAAGAATAFAVINALTLGGSTPHASVSIGGETRSLDTELNPDVNLAWGSYAVLFLSAAALLAALATRRETLIFTTQVYAGLAEGGREQAAAKLVEGGFGA